MISRLQGVKTVDKMVKIDLHCHLDGSIPFAFVKKVCRMRGECYSDEEIIKQIQVDETCNSLTQYLDKFDLSIRCMSQQDLISQAAEAFMGSLVTDNVKYVEVRFSTALLRTKDLSEKQIMESVLKGLELGRKKYGIFYQVIVCAMRHLDFETNLQTFRVAEEFLGNGVCAVDLAGDESRYPTEQFSELFCRGREMHFPITIHAGECGSAESIRHALDMGAARIGHGIAMRGRNDLQEICRERGIGIEMCPISNLQTGAVKDIDEYPIMEFLKNNLCVTVNTDNRIVSNTSITRELNFLKQKFGISDSDVFTLERNAVQCSFADHAVKKRLYKMIEEDEKRYANTAQ